MGKGEREHSCSRWGEVGRVVESIIEGNNIYIIYTHTNKHTNTDTARHIHTNMFVLQHTANGRRITFLGSRMARKKGKGRDLSI